MTPLPPRTRQAGRAYGTGPTVHDATHAPGTPAVSPMYPLSPASPVAGGQGHALGVPAP